MVVMNPHTEYAVEAILRHTPHAVLLYGDEGAGKNYLAGYIARRILDEKTTKSPHIHQIQPEDQSITIAQVRHIKELTKLRVPGKQAIRRVIIIQDAHLMREEAQNALLKTLEEPPVDTVLLLTARSTESLAETIISRVTAVSVRPVAHEAAAELFPESNPKQVDRAYHISNGNIGLMSALIKNEDHPLLEYIESAKKIIASTRYERLCQVEVLRKDKVALGQLLYCMKRILHFKMSRHPSSTHVKRLKLVAAAEDDVRKNVQPRLVLTDLFLNM